MNQYNNPKKSDWKSLVSRPYIDNGSIYETVIDVFKTVKENGDVSLRELTKKFDKVELKNIKVEIAPNIGLSDAVCDIVSTGNTLFKNNLKEVFTIFKSQAVLCNSRSFDKEKDLLLEKLVFRINSVLRAKRSKYILMNVPNDKIKAVSNLLPVLKSPTILPLEIEGWSSLHTVIDDDKFWESIDSIKEAGAKDILVCPIEKMVR